MIKSYLRCLQIGATQSMFKCSWRSIERPAANMSLLSSTLFNTPEFYRRPLPRSCVPFSSTEGRLLFREALADGHMEAYFALASQLCTQDEPSYCGLATLVMILNAYEMDPGTVWKRPWRWYHESLLKCCVPADVLKEGIVMDQFVTIAQCHGLNVESHRVTNTDGFANFRAVVSQLTANDHEGFLVVCYHRGAVGQTGSGHFAAVGGYHAERELVFLFDTARFKYPPHWVPITCLWDGMSRIDPATGQPRGYMILTKADSFQLSRANLQSQLPDPILFMISDGARHAYLLPSALRDPNSIGYRLRSAADSWKTWLSSDINRDEQDVESLLTEGAKFLLDTFARHTPRSFFFGVLQTVDEESCVRAKQQLMIRELLTSSVGQIVSRLVAGLPDDLFQWFTTHGTFQLSVLRMSGSLRSKGSRPIGSCPFAEINDSGLRLSLLLTTFICAYPYDNVSSLTVAESCNRSHLLKSYISSVGFSDTTKAELDSLRLGLCLLISSALPIDDASNPHCATHPCKQTTQ